MSLVYDRINAYNEHGRLKSLANTCTKIYFVDWLICGLPNGSRYYGVKFAILYTNRMCRNDSRNYLIFLFL